LKERKGINYGQACVGTVVNYGEVYGWPGMAEEAERRLGFEEFLSSIILRTSEFSWAG
jgi:hypothetical protein